MKYCLVKCIALLTLLTETWSGFAWATEEHHSSCNVPTAVRRAALAIAAERALSATGVGGARASGGRRVRGGAAMDRGLVYSSLYSVGGYDPSTPRLSTTPGYIINEFNIPTLVARAAERSRADAPTTMTAHETERAGRSAAERYARRHSTLDGVPYTITRIAEGGTSYVYMLHRAGSPSNTGTRVIKVRSYVRHGETNVSLQTLRRDLFAHRLATELADEVRLNGEPLIEVAPYLSTPEELANGLLIQEAVHGPTAYELENALRVAENPHQYPGQSTRISNAQDVLRRAGIDPADSTALGAMRTRLNALSQFYCNVHDLTLNAIQSEGMNPYYNRDYRGLTREEYAALDPGGHERLNVLVGLDFNHGRNVIWRPPSEGRPGRFVIIDQ